MAKITLDDIAKNEMVKVYLEGANKLLEALGYTEHGQRHANLTANIARNILLRLGYSKEEAELAAIAGYIHDVGNLVGRINHGQASALFASQLLGKLGMEAKDMVTIMGAVGNHEEEIGDPASPQAAALVLADKSDVHRSRVRNPNLATFDIHDRVNYAAEHSFVRVDKDKSTVTLDLSIDTKISQVMEYFEIFLSRMMICRRAAKVLNCNFELVINGVKLL
jgi:metal-dependent HD superfamily phosphatase/phosphodiesterase